MDDPRHPTPDDDQRAAPREQLQRRERGDAEGPTSAADPVPTEWLAAFAGRDGAAAEPASATTSADPLVTEWEAWQSRPTQADPFQALPDDPPAEAAPSYDEVMAARAQVLDDGTADLRADRDGTPAPGVDSDAPFALAPASPGAAAAAAVDDGGPLEFIDEPQLPPPLVRATAAQRPPQRVTIHLLDGQVRRGEARDAQLDGESFSYVSQSGSNESLARAALRAVFFLRSPDAPQPEPVGPELRVTFRDGRELVGSSADHAQIADFFTLVPSDPRANAALVWIARSAVRNVAPLQR